MAAGAIAVGGLVTVTGFSGAFLVVVACMLPALVLARREAQPNRATEMDLRPLPVVA
jgi:hypothetical protein